MERLETIGGECATEVGANEGKTNQYFNVFQFCTNQLDLFSLQLFGKE